MLLVISGAGASYDSVLHLPPDPPTSRVSKSLRPEHFRPPLANQLFDDRELFVEQMEAYPACKPLVNLLRGDIQVEKKLAEFEEQAKTFPVRHKQLAAIRYYLHGVLGRCQDFWRNEHKGITNYLTFVDAIDRWRYENKEQVCFVTFNYDTMLEQALTELWGWKFDQFSSYTSDARFKLIKLHGSIDWGFHLNTVPGQGTPAEIIDAAVAGLSVSDVYGKVDSKMMFQDGKFGFPALAIPVEKKSEFVCQQEHLRALADVLPRVTKIITVGWRATEQNFLTMLKNPLTGLQGDVDLMVVSGSLDGATETNNNLGLVNPSSGHRYDTLADGFSGLIRGVGHLEQFLQARMPARR
jgi:SIR2-like domain